ncbi:hypothetical protein [Mesorhizobium huakuii]|uniref:Uncharacterized protein n=1 Tax=Mesorhizobium huakuii TaxID=28104 RepID=A0A7G6SYG8_9HYPH|nr:hypothetical protein [Mesorhizobium huakuii]QND59550.1 hypothetical protein HB778_25480 [Mesorhizobium huakuii]
MSNFQSATGLLAKAARAANINVTVKIFCQNFLMKRGRIATSYSGKKTKSQKLNGKPLRGGEFQLRSLSIALLAGSAHKGLSFTPRGSTVIFAGKRASVHSMPQHRQWH